MSKNPKDIIEFTLLYNRYKTQIYNYVIRMVNDEMLCEDIIQNVFLKLFENLHLIKNRNSTIYWIFRTARNEIYDYYRKKKVRLNYLTSTDDISSKLFDEDNLEYNYELKEVKEIILQKLDELPAEQKEVFLLKEYGELSYKEIATITEIDEKLVKNRLYKTRQKLIKHISKVV